MEAVLDFVVCFAPIALVSYLCGCFNGALMISRRILHDDVREHGSGNAGLTNFYRNYGARYAGLVIALDMFKAVAAVVFALVYLRIIGKSEFDLLGKYVAALFCVLGHMFPVMYGFRGGKGILCGGMLLILSDWRVAIVAWGLFALLLLATRYVSLGSIAAAASFPVSTWLFIDRGWLMLTLSALTGGLIIYGHRQNIVRLLSGTERKLSRHKKSAEGDGK